MSIGHQAVFPKGNALRGTTCASLAPGDGKTLYQTRDCVNTWLIHFLLAREFTWVQQLTSGQARGPPGGDFTRQKMPMEKNNIR